MYLYNGKNGFLINFCITTFSALFNVQGWPDLVKFGQEHQKLPADLLKCSGYLLCIFILTVCENSIFMILIKNSRFLCLKEKI